MKKLLAIIALLTMLTGCFGIPQSTMIFDGIWYAIHTVPIPKQPAKVEDEEKKN